MSAPTDPTPSRGVTALPPGTRLIHIGPHKTGTTALQSAFHANRVELARQSVHYAGQGQQPAEAVIAVNQRRPMRGERQTGMRAWTQLVNEIGDAGPRRVFLSSEFFTDSDEASIRRIIGDIDHPSTHVLVTLRSLWRIAPSQWQQYVQNGHRATFETWLDGLLNKPPYTWPSPSFWNRHCHGDLIARWADVVGRDRMTVVVVDESDPTMLMRTVEQLLDLEPGTLVPQSDRANRSLTWPEADLLRRLNRIHDKLGWPDATYAELVRRGAVREIKSHESPTGQPRVAIPTWAHDALERRALDSVASIGSSGVRVIGDLDALTHPLVHDRPSAHQLRIPSDVAAHAVIGVVRASGDVPDRQSPRLGQAPLRSLVAAVVTRLAERLRVRATAGAAHLVHHRFGGRSR